ncbi:MAG: hypothetical protein R6X20_09275 [Phycisphaerae bacterium]
MRSAEQGNLVRGGSPDLPRERRRLRFGAAGAETRRAKARLATPTARLFLAFVALGVAARSPAGAAEAPDRTALGREVKYRVLVDKVMQPTRDWVTEEWMVEEAARTGFNVFCPRAGYDRLDEVRRAAAWCRERGIFFMPWMRGTLGAPKGKEADGKRYVWADGTVEPLWSPNSDAFWDWTARYVVAYATIAAENPHLVGVFLDYENYWTKGKPNCYDLSYDDIILEKFAKARGLDLPALPVAERKAWLQEKGLHDAFAAFQVDHWRTRCRALRKAVDSRDPGFRFCVYPAPGTPFMVQALYPEWATKRAPLVLADACTYGNRSGALLLRNGLLANRDRLLERRKVPEEAGINYLYVGGIDPAVRGAGPEFSGKNADIISQATDGYWVFYEGPEYAYEGPDPKKNHRAYFDWFARANRDIAAGRFDLWQEPRESPDAETQAVLALVRRLREAGLAPLTDEPLPEKARGTTFRIRQRHTVLIRVADGETLAGRLACRQLARYTTPCAYVLLNLDGKRLGHGHVPPGKAVEISRPPGEAGWYLLILDTGRNAARFHARSQHTCLVGPRLHLIHAQPRAYFLPMPGAERIRLVLESPSPGETARLVLRDPDGREVAAADTVEKERVEVTAKIPPPARGRPWSVDLGKAKTGGCEDMTLEFLGGAVPLLAPHPGRLLGVERAVSF